MTLMKINNLYSYHRCKQKLHSLWFHPWSSVWRCTHLHAPCVQPLQWWWTCCQMFQCPRCWTDAAVHLDSSSKCNRTTYSIFVNNQNCVFNRVITISEPADILLEGEQGWCEGAQQGEAVTLLHPGWGEEGAKLDFFVQLRGWKKQEEDQVMWCVVVMSTDETEI